MSYYLGRSDFSSYRSSFDTGRYLSYGRSSYSLDSWRTNLYSRPSYDSSFWRSSPSSYSHSSYKPTTYDFGSLSGLSSSYSSKYGDSSWRTRDTAGKGYSSIEERKDYLSNDNSTEDNLRKEKATKEPSESGKGVLIKDTSKDDLSKDNKFDEDYSSKSKGPSLKDFTATDSSSKEYFPRTKKYTEDKSEDYLSKYSSDKRDLLSKYLGEDEKKPKDEGGKLKHSNANITKDFPRYGASSYKRDKYGSYGLVDSTKTLTLDDRKDDPGSQDKRKVAKNENKSTPNKKYFDFEDAVQENAKESILFAEKETVFDTPDSYKPKTSGRYNVDDHGQLHKPMENNNHLKNNIPPFYSEAKETNKDIGHWSPKTRGRINSDSGPMSLHRTGIRKFISVVPEENRYITSVNYLPDRIELRLCGTAPNERKVKKWRSIPDLYNITLKPQPSDDETIQCDEQSMTYAYDSSNEILNYNVPKHEHMKEMYVTQYTHHFDPEEPRSHIAGWKVDVEPRGIPHEKSRMCVMKHPVVSGPSRWRPPRPKSAPPMVRVRSESPETPIRSQRVDVVDRGYYTSPRSSRVSDSVFYNSIEDSTDASSLGYAPSDDTSDSSAFFDPRSPTRPNLHLSKPKLIRLSAEFPGIRNLEKMRRKRQSMGSPTSPKPRSSLGHSPSPRDGEYGFFVALTSGESPKLQSKSGRYYSHH